MTPPLRLRQEPAVINAYIALNLAGYRPIDRRPQPLRRRLLRDLRLMQDVPSVVAFGRFLRRRFTTIDEYRTAVAPLFLSVNPWRIPVPSVARWIDAIVSIPAVRRWRRMVYLPSVGTLIAAMPGIATRGQTYARQAALLFRTPLHHLRIDVHLNPLDTPGYGSTYAFGQRRVISVAPLPHAVLPTVTLLHEILHCAYEQRRQQPFRFPRTLPVPSPYRKDPRSLRQEEYAVRAAVHLIKASGRTAAEQRRAVRDDVRYGFRALPVLLRSARSLKYTI